MSARPAPACLLLGILAWLVCALVAPNVSAVIIASGDGTGNTTAPEDDFGFANVGIVGQTAVYIGDGWVITANHVAPGPVTLQGRAFEPVPDSKVRMVNEPGRLAADLAVFRLKAPWPDLPALPIAERPPRIGEEVVMVGNGHDRGDPVREGGTRGWTWASSTSLRWGTNRVSGHHPGMSINRGDDTDAFSTELDQRDATEHEAQVAIGDSGGGVFVKRDGTWELAGVLIAANTYKSQPPDTCLYGNVSLAADLSVYRDQILRATGRGRLPPASCESICGEGFASSLLAPVILRARRRRRTREGQANPTRPAGQFT